MPLLPHCIFLLEWTSCRTLRFLDNIPLISLSILHITASGQCLWRTVGQLLLSTKKTRNAMTSSKTGKYCLVKGLKSFILSCLSVEKMLFHHLTMLQRKRPIYGGKSCETIKIVRQFFAHTMHFSFLKSLKRERSTKKETETHSTRLSGKVGQ